MKKIVALMLTAIMLLTAMPAALADEPIKLEFYFGLGGNLGDMYLGLIEEYNNSQDQYEIVGVQFPDFGATQEAFHAALSAKKPPAVWLSQQQRFQVFEDYLMPLNDLYANDAEFNASDILAGAMLCMVGTDGETLYAAPAYSSTHVMYYNLEAFEGYDLADAFSSWQRLAEVSKEIVADESNGFTWGMMPTWRVDTWVNAVYSAGGTVFTDPEKKTVNFLADEWVDVMSSFQKWFLEDKTMYTNYGGTGWEYWYANIDDVLAGKAGGYTGSPADMGDLDFSKVACIMTPGWNGNAPCTVCEAQCYVIPNGLTDEEKAGAWDFVKFMNTAHAQAQITIIGGYLPTRESTLSDPDLLEHMKTMPAIEEATRQLNASRSKELDPTGGYVYDAVEDMYDNVLIEGMDVYEALELCQEEAQNALDEYWSNVE